MRRILISNDDGVFSPGLAALAHKLAEKSSVRVIAPDRDHSGASNSLTLSRPLTIDTLENGFYKCDGTPTDCVHMGLRLFHDHMPDFVVSGINRGPNLGDDVLYSGTVAAAMEGRHLGIPALAVSLQGDSEWHWETAAELAAVMVEHLPTWPAGRVMNLNVPALPLDQIKGIKMTRLGHRTAGAAPISATDPRGRERFWLSLQGEALDKGEGTDFDALEQGYASVTPVQPDMTDYSALAQMDIQWP